MTRMKDSLLWVSTGMNNGWKLKNQPGKWPAVEERVIASAVGRSSGYICPSGHSANKEAFRDGGVD